MKKRNLDLIDGMWFFLIVIVVATLLWFGYWSLIGVDPHHDGIMLKPAMDVASGQMVFRDTFTQYGLLSVLIPACALHFCGYLITLKLLVVCFYAGCAALLYLISRKVMRIEFAWIPVFLMFVLAPFYFWTFHPWSSVIALFFSLLLNYLTILLMERFFQSKNPDGANSQDSATNDETADDETADDETAGDETADDEAADDEAADDPDSSRPEWAWLGIGVLSAVPFWCRQPTGLVVPSAIILLILLNWFYNDGVKNTLKRIFYYLCGVTLGFFSVVAWLVMNHAVRDFLLQSLRFAARFATDRTEGSVRVFYQINFPIDQFLFGFIFFLVFAWFFYLCWRIFVQKNMKPADWYFLSVILFSGAALHQYFPVPCIRHLYWGALPAFVVYARLFQGIWDSKFVVRPVVWLACAVLIGLPIVRLAIHLEYNPRVFNTWHKISELSTLETYTHDGVLKRMRMMPQEKQYWESVQTAIESIPPEYADRPVINLTQNGLPSLLFKNQKNWHPMYMNWQGVYPEFGFIQNKQLESGQSLIILMVPRNNPETYNKLDCFKKYKVWRTIPHWQFEANTVIFIPHSANDTETGRETTTETGPATKPATANDPK